MEIVSKLKEIAQCELELRFLYIDVLSAVIGGGAPAKQQLAQALKLNLMPDGDADSDEKHAAAENKPAGKSKVPPWPIYLRSKRKSESMLGELVRQALADEQFPHSGDISAMRAYLRQHAGKYPENALRTLNNLWSNFQKLK